MYTNYRASFPSSARALYIFDGINRVRARAIGSRAVRACFRSSCIYIHVQALTRTYRLPLFPLKRSNGFFSKSRYVPFRYFVKRRKVSPTLFFFVWDEEYIVGTASQGKRDISPDSRIVRRSVWGVTLKRYERGSCAGFRMNDGRRETALYAFREILNRGNRERREETFFKGSGFFFVCAAAFYARSLGTE